MSATKLNKKRKKGLNSKALQEDPKDFNPDGEDNTHDLDLEIQQHVKDKKEIKKKKVKLNRNSTKEKIVTRLQDKVAIRSNALRIFSGLRRKMPTFMMYSRFDKNLLKNMLFKATEITEEEVTELRLKYFGGGQQAESASID
jgi:hypothetical protein